MVMMVVGGMGCERESVTHTKMTRNEVWSFGGSDVVGS